MFDNSYKDSRGSVLGFVCDTCGGVFSSMWGETCNRCREENELRALQKENLRLKNERLKSKQK